MIDMSSEINIYEIYVYLFPLPHCKTKSIILAKLELLIKDNWFDLIINMPHSFVFFRCQMVPHWLAFIVVKFGK
jgi:hypothetical protein